MPEVVVSRFAASYHGTLKIRKVKEKFLRRLIALELEERPDIPKPFTFGFRVCGETESELEVSLSVVKEDEVLGILRDSPDVDCIVSEEVALASTAKGIFGEGFCWCVGAYPDGIRMSLCKNACVLYSTVVPVMGDSLGEGEVELVNSTFRYAYNVVGEMPEEGVVIGPWADQLIAQDLVVSLRPLEALDYSFEDIEPYNLIPVSILEKRRLGSLSRLVYRGVAALLVVGLSLDLWLGYSFLRMRRIVSEQQREVEEVYSLYNQIMDLRKQAERIKSGVEKRKSMLKSFDTANLAFGVYKLLKSLGYVSFDGIKACCSEVSVSGRVKADTRAQGFLLYTELVEHFRRMGRVVSQTYDPERRTFSLKLRGE